MRKTMLTMKKSWGSWFLLPLLLLSLSACSSSSDSDVTAVTSDSTATTISGTAAAGAPIVGTINIRGANGEISTSAIRADGSYTVDVAALSAPFLIWAEGTANGQSVRLYSTVQAAGDVANVTPATNLVMAMALEADPAVVYGAFGSTTPPTMPPPAATTIFAAAADVNTLLASLFVNLGIDGFDVMNGTFVVGDAFDDILDTVSFQVNSTDSANVTVTITDKATVTDLYVQNVTTGSIITELSATEVAEIVAAGLSFHEQALAIMKKIESLYATSIPDVTTLQNTLLPYMTPDYLEEGRDAEGNFSQWTENDGPMIGMKVIAVNILRPMGEQTHNGTTLSEMPGYSEGYWCTVTVTDEGIIPFTFATSFVKDGEIYKWHGDRTPVDSGGDAEAQHTRSVGYNGTSIWSGLQFHANDVGNLAKDTYGIDAILVLHPALPDLTDFNPNLSGLNGVLLVNDPTTPETYFSLTSIFPPAHSSDCVTPEDGLNLAGLKVGDEIVFIGTDMNGVPKHVWIHWLRAVPLAAANLTDGHFATITTPAALSDVSTIPESITVSWTMPTALTTFTQWVHIGWGDSTSWENRDMENPVFGAEWTSATFDTSSTTVTTANYMYISVNTSPDDNMTFRSEISLQ